MGEIAHLVSISFLCFLAAETRRLDPAGRGNPAALLLNLQPEQPSTHWFSNNAPWFYCNMEKVQIVHDTMYKIQFLGNPGSLSLSNKRTKLKFLVLMFRIMCSNFNSFEHGCKQPWICPPFLSPNLSLTHTWELACGWSCLSLQINIFLAGRPKIHKKDQTSALDKKLWYGASSNILFYYWVYMPTFPQEHQGGIRLSPPFYSHNGTVKQVRQRDSEPPSPYWEREDEAAGSSA